jgi:hypothetical protein
MFNQRIIHLIVLLLFLNNINANYILKNSNNETIKECTYLVYLNNNSYVEYRNYYINETTRECEYLGLTRPKDLYCVSEYNEDDGNNCNECIDANIIKANVSCILDNCMYNNTKIKFKIKDAECIKNNYDYCKSFYNKNDTDTTLNNEKSNNYNECDENSIDIYNEQILEIVDNNKLITGSIDNTEDKEENKDDEDIDSNEIPENDNKSTLNQQTTSNNDEEDIRDNKISENDNKSTLNQQTNSNNDEEDINYNNDEEDIDANKIPDSDNKSTLNQQTTSNNDEEDINYNNDEEDIDANKIPDSDNKSTLNQQTNSNNDEEDINYNNDEEDIDANKIPDSDNKSTLNQQTTSNNELTKNITNNYNITLCEIVNQEFNFVYNNTFYTAIYNETDLIYITYKYNNINYIYIKNQNNCIIKDYTVIEHIDDNILNEYYNMKNQNNNNVIYILLLIVLIIILSIVFICLYINMKTKNKRKYTIINT